MTLSLLGMCVALFGMGGLALWFTHKWQKAARRNAALEVCLADEIEDGHETAGLLADVCDAAFDDEERALNHGYTGVLERVRELVAKEGA